MTKPDMNNPAFTIGNSKARRDGSKLDGSEIGNGEVGGDEIDDEVGKKG